MKEPADLHVMARSGDINMFFGGITLLQLCIVLKFKSPPRHFDDLVGV